MIYFKNRMILFVIIILSNAYWFYTSDFIPSEFQALILINIYLGFIVNGIGIKKKESGK